MYECVSDNSCTIKDLTTTNQKYVETRKIFGHPDWELQKKLKAPSPPWSSGQPTRASCHPPANSSNFIPTQAPGYFPFFTWFELLLNGSSAWG